MRPKQVFSTIIMSLVLIGILYTGYPGVNPPLLPTHTPSFRKRFQHYFVSETEIERCPPRHKSRVERLKAKVEPLSTSVTVETPNDDLWISRECGSEEGSYLRLMDFCITEL